MMNTNDAVSLDFWNGLAFYSGKSFPCGTIGCDALNISAEVIERLKELCTVQYALINALTFGPGILHCFRLRGKVQSRLRGSCKM